MPTTSSLNKITAADIARAAANPDQNEALGALQSIAQVETGDVAAHVFSDMNEDEWRAASVAEREEKVHDWIRTEMSYVVSDGEDNFADVLAVLVKNDGACLYWQMPDVARGEAAANAGIVKMVDDLLVHPAAIEIEAGTSYTMTDEAEQIREEQDDKIIRRTNWDDPTSRLALIEAVGADEYNRLIAEHHRRQTVATVNGHGIRIIGSRFGRLFMVDGTDRAFSTRDEADAFARSL
ncbi:MAG TPA: hypothetical protein VGQ63_14010 [Pseudolabrys sp.]|jgi:hypothetical protein|nr:hypothetical protein [Pseudolabrys sp.]